jgi:hypothetical protein
MRNQAGWLQNSESLLIDRSAARFPENQNGFISSSQNFAEHDLNHDLNMHLDCLFRASGASRGTGVLGSRPPRSISLPDVCCQKSAFGYRRYSSQQQPGSYALSLVFLRLGISLMHTGSNRAAFGPGIDHHGALVAA